MGHSLCNVWIPNLRSKQGFCLLRTHSSTDNGKERQGPDFRGRTHARRSAIGSIGRRAQRLSPLHRHRSGSGASGDIVVVSWRRRIYRSNVRDPNRVIECRPRCPAPPCFLRCLSEIQPETCSCSDVLVKGYTALSFYAPPFSSPIPSKFYYKKEDSPSYQNVSKYMEY
jgi:hypothetical protein